MVGFDPTAWVTARFRNGDILLEPVRAGDPRIPQVGVSAVFPLPPLAPPPPPTPPAPAMAASASTPADTTAPHSATTLPCGYIISLPAAIGGHDFAARAGPALDTPVVQQHHHGELVHCRLQSAQINRWITARFRNGDVMLQPAPAAVLAPPVPATGLPVDVVDVRGTTSSVAAAGDAARAMVRVLRRVDGKEG